MIIQLLVQVLILVLFVILQSEPVAIQDAEDLTLSPLINQQPIIVEINLMVLSKEIYRQPEIDLKIFTCLIIHTSIKSKNLTLKL